MAIGKESMERAAKAAGRKMGNTKAAEKKGGTEKASAQKDGGIEKVSARKNRVEKASAQKDTDILSNKIFAIGDDMPIYYF